MIQVRLAVPVDSAVVEELHAGAGKVLLEPLARERLAFGFLLPRARALRFVDQPRESDTQVTESLARVVFAFLAAAIVLALSARTRGPGLHLDIGRRLRFIELGARLRDRTVHAGHELDLAIPERLVAGSEFPPAASAPVRAAQSHAF